MPSRTCYKPAFTALPWLTRTEPKLDAAVACNRRVAEEALAIKAAGNSPTKGYLGLTDDYGPADNSKMCYDLAIDTLQENLESFKRERIGDCSLYLTRLRLRPTRYIGTT